MALLSLSPSLPPSRPHAQHTRQRWHPLIAGGGGQAMQGAWEQLSVVANAKLKHYHQQLSALQHASAKVCGA
eukprot:1146037-Rhodomonas_salina.1